MVPSLLLWQKSLRNTLLHWFQADFFTFLSHKNGTLTQQYCHASVEQYYCGLGHDLLEDLYWCDMDQLSRWTENRVTYVPQTVISDKALLLQLWNCAERGFWTFAFYIDLCHMYSIAKELILVYQISTVCIENIFYLSSNNHEPSILTMSWFLKVAYRLNKLWLSVVLFLLNEL